MLSTPGLLTPSWRGTWCLTTPPGGSRIPPCCAPGRNTDQAGLTTAQKPFLGLLKGFVKTPEQGAETSIYLASELGVAGLTAKYWTDCQAVSSSTESYDCEIAKKLWEVSEELIASKM